jgi:NADH:ubiquinone oxidoreductase subunit 6 (subunit J)
VSQVLFFIAAIGALVAAGAVVLLRNAFYSVLALVAHLVCLAVLFMLLRAEFVAAAQVVIYAGAVMVLYVFVVAYIGGSEEVTAGSGMLRIIGPLFALALAVELLIALLGSGLAGISGKGAVYHTGFGTPAHIGKLFLVNYLFPFEVASLLLLVAAVGAVVLARRHHGALDLSPELEALATEPRPEFTGTTAEGVGVRRVYRQLEAASERVTRISESGGVLEPDDAGESTGATVPAAAGVSAGAVTSPSQDAAAGTHDAEGER